ncbi:MAG: sulfurtransferase TusA family protein [Candidatus Hydrothermarchaeaceae archaeon]
METLDIRGEKCPDTFVFTKIKLEDVAYSGGGTLKVILDFPPAVENISRSLREEKINYKVLEVKSKGNNVYEMLIEAPPTK